MIRMLTSLEGYLRIKVVESKAYDGVSSKRFRASERETSNVKGLNAVCQMVEVTSVQTRL